MTRHPYDQRSSSPAVQRAREKLTASGAVASRVTRDVAAPGGVRVDLDIKVADLEEVGVDIDETLPRAWVSDMLDDGKSPRWMGHGDATLRLHLENEASFVRVTGQAHFLLSHPCVRCLSDVPFDVKLDVDLRLVEKVEGPIEGAWGEGDADGDDFEGPSLGDASDLEDLNIASYQDGVVRVRDLLREQLFLELPMHPACDSREARPERECAFDEHSANAGERAGWTTSRWAGLAALRDRLPPGPKNNEGKKMNTPDPKPAATNHPAGAPSTTWDKPDEFYARDTQVMQSIPDGDDEGDLMPPPTKADEEVTAVVAKPVVAKPVVAKPVVVRPAAVVKAVPPASVVVAKPAAPPAPPARAPAAQAPKKATATKAAPKMAKAAKANAPKNAKAKKAAPKKAKRAAPKKAKAKQAAPKKAAPKKAKAKKAKAKKAKAKKR